MREILSDQLQTIKEGGTWKTERVITSAQEGAINIQDSKKKVLNFCANNYLGLSVSNATCCVLAVYLSVFVFSL